MKRFLILLAIIVREVSLMHVPRHVYDYANENKSSERNFYFSHLPKTSPMLTYLKIKPNGNGPLKMDLNMSLTNKMPVKIKPTKGMSMKTFHSVQIRAPNPLIQNQNSMANMGKGDKLSSTESKSDLKPAVKELYKIFFNENKNQLSKALKDSLLQGIEEQKNKTRNKSDNKKLKINHIPLSKTLSKLTKVKVSYPLYVLPAAEDALPPPDWPKVHLPNTNRPNMNQSVKYYGTNKIKQVNKTMTKVKGHFKGTLITYNLKLDKDGNGSHYYHHSDIDTVNKHNHFHHTSDNYQPHNYNTDNNHILSTLPYNLFSINSNHPPFFSYTSNYSVNNLKPEASKNMTNNFICVLNVKDGKNYLILRANSRNGSYEISDNAKIYEEGSLDSLKRKASSRRIPRFDIVYSEQLPNSIEAVNKVTARVKSENKENRRIICVVDTDPHHLVTRPTTTPTTTTNSPIQQIPTYPPVHSTTETPTEQPTVTVTTKPQTVVDYLNAGASVLMSEANNHMYSGYKALRTRVKNFISDQMANIILVSSVGIPVAVAVLSVVGAPPLLLSVLSIASPFVMQTVSSVMST